MAPPVQARHNTVHVKPKSNTNMASEHGSCSEEIQTKSNPQRKLLNDKLDNYLRVQGTRTMYMVTCMAVLLPVCISSSGVLVWHIVRTGNDALHRLTSCSDVQLRVDLWSWENETIYAEYIGFSIGDEDSNYVLRIGNYTGGNASDEMTYHNGMSFSTFDRDNDVVDFRHCAVDFLAAWWYKSCYRSNLNGPYSSTSSVPYGLGITWHRWKGYTYSLMKTEMKIRRA